MAVVADPLSLSGPSWRQPVVILGGFLIGADAYRPMKEILGSRSGHVVEIVTVSRLEWMLTVLPQAWATILDRVAKAVERGAERSPTGKVTLVGHSSGGVMLRLFLDGAPFQGRCYDGRRRANRLVTLGSPHTALRATPLRRMVDRRLPGAFFNSDGDSDSVHYVSVAGDLDLEEGTPLARRLAPTAYRNSTGHALDAGDGLVPVASALLAGAESIVLPGVAHGGAFGDRWYGSPDVVNRWWSAPPEPSGSG